MCICPRAVRKTYNAFSQADTLTALMEVEDRPWKLTGERGPAPQEGTFEPPIFTRFGEVGFINQQGSTVTIQNM